MMNLLGKLSWDAIPFDQPIVMGASTYAVGKVFVQHFEMGGTLLDFDPTKTKEFFAREYKEGQKVAADLRASV